MYPQAIRQADRLPPLSETPFLEHVVGNLIRGLLLLTEQQEILYINTCANRILQQLNRNSNEQTLIPSEIEHICNFLIQNRTLFPHQLWIHESKVFIDGSKSIRVQARWLTLETFRDPCLCLVMEDDNQLIQEIAIGEAHRYGFTAREVQVWILHRMSYTYKDIAKELKITVNTVKKHMKSILTKRQQVSSLTE